MIYKETEKKDTVNRLLLVKVKHVHASTGSLVVNIFLLFITSHQFQKKAT